MSVLSYSFSTVKKGPIRYLSNIKVSFNFGQK